MATQADEKTIQTIMKTTKVSRHEAEKFLAGMKQGIADSKAGHMHPWSQVKRELGL